MKRKTLLLLPLIIGSLPLVGCANSEYYSVTVDDDKYILEMPHKLGEKPSKKFKPGDGVIFRVDMITDVDTIVELNGNRLEPQNFIYGDESEDNRWSIPYTFVMPKMDCEISVYLRGGWW